jgi:4-hydroxybenzoate polyprenyltransferase
MSNASSALSCSLSDMIATLSRYLSLVKFSHTVFALPFAMVGLAWGFADGGYYSWVKLGWVLVCMVTARTAAMAFNRWADRRYDAANPRTVVREIPAGQISPSAALALVGVNLALFVFATSQINSLCFALSPVALAVVLGYSFTKRFTPLCHLVLGAGLGLAPVGAYLAATGVFAWAPVLLGLAVFAWVSGFDIIYALQDEEFDRAQGLQSIPAWLGGERALAVSRGLHTIAAVLLATAGYQQGAGWVFAGAWVVFALLLVRQHRLVSAKDLSRVNLAFFTTNGIGSVVFGLLALLDLGLRHWR